jgi:hypothetical protein
MGGCRQKGLNMGDCHQLWEQFVRLSTEMETIRVNLLNHCSGELSNLVHRGFYDPGSRGAAFELIHWMRHDKRTEFLPQLVELASYANKYTETSRRAILELPRRWTIENIRAACEPVLRRDSAHEEEFGLIFPLVEELDRAIALDLAKAATKFNSSEIRRLATEYVEAQPTQGG